MIFLSHQSLYFACSLSKFDGIQIHPFMKTTALFITLFICARITNAQINSTTPWAWMKGDNNIDQPGLYGTQGVSAATNKPGSRNSSSTWRDNAGNLWLFGGSGFGNTSTTGYLNDLWKYDPYSNQWTWMKGDNSVNQYSVYGSQGVANTNNKPGGMYSGLSWKDASGNLWLFGGFGYTNNNFGFLNTLWKYNTATNQWTWVSGDKTVNKVGVYGTKGVAASTNKPGARYGSQTWTDAAGNLWLFGGYGYDITTSGILNDVWKYNPTTNQWTWVSGDNTINQHGVYGTQGVTSATSKPGARYVSTSWTDATGNLWLFGGYGYDESSEGNLNDIWKYDPVSNKWTWMNGDKLINQLGRYGVQGSFAPTNNPGARYVSSSWIDINGDLWLFGGYGYDGSSPGYLNDFWKYSTTLNQWSWVKGDATVNNAGIYGIQGVPDYTSKSGARNGSVSWTDGNGNLWFFGGYGYDDNTQGVLNDLWKISNFQAVLPLHLLSFTGTLTNNRTQLTWESEMEAVFSHFNIQRSFDGVSFTTIAQVNGTGNSNRHTYHLEDNDLTGRAFQTVYYRLQLVNNDGSYTFSKILRFDIRQENMFRAYPNPAVNTLNLSFRQANAGTASIQVMAMNGTLVNNVSIALPAGSASYSLDVSRLPSGTYLVSVFAGTNRMVQSFVKE